MEVHLTRVDLVVVGAASAAIEPAIVDYERRIGRYVRLRVHELKGEPLQRGPEQVRSAEGARILATIESVASQGAGNPTVVALDRQGAALDSEALAERMLGAKHLVLVVGGACGLAPEVLERCGRAIGFGAVTMPHQIARLVVTEQLYRAFRIARGEPYHY